RLRKDQLQLRARTLHQRRAGLRAHADPADAGRRRDRAIRLDRDLESFPMERVDQWRVELEQRLAPRADDVRPDSLRTDTVGADLVSALLHPFRSDSTREITGMGELPAARSVGPHEIRIAELAHRLGAI